MIRCYIAEGVRGDRSLCDTVNSDVGDLITRIGSYGKVWLPPCATLTEPVGVMVPPVPAVAVMV